MSSLLWALEPDAASTELVLDGGHLVPEGQDRGSQRGIGSVQAAGQEV
jgi:hypothetical protein